MRSEDELLNLDPSRICWRDRDTTNSLLNGDDRAYQGPLSPIGKVSAGCSYLMLVVPGWFTGEAIRICSVCRADTNAAACGPVQARRSVTESGPDHSEGQCDAAVKIV